MSRRRSEVHARERARREAGAARRAARPQPEGGPGHRALPSGPDAVLFVAANLVDTDDGTWNVHVEATGVGTVAAGPTHPAPPALRDDGVTGSFPDLITARDGVLALVDDLADYTDLNVATLWHYNGDQSRWPELVAQHDLTAGLPPNVGARLDAGRP